MTVDNVCIIIGFWIGLGGYAWWQYRAEKKRIKRRRARFAALRKNNRAYSERKARHEGV